MNAEGHYSSKWLCFKLFAFVDALYLVIMADDCQMLP